MDYNQAALQMHEEHHGKVAVQSKVKVENRDDLSTAYTPGVAEPCRRIHADPRDVYRYTAKGNLVAVVSDGTAVLGLGDIGPLAAMPVMEGKAILFKEFADVDAFPICLDTKDVDEIVRTVKAIAPTFGGINLEDISAPRCFEIESRLRKELDGAGSAGISIAKLLLQFGAGNIVLVDRAGAVSVDEEWLNPAQRKMAEITNRHNERGSLADVMKDKDVFIGVSAPKIVTAEMVSTMAKDAIVFAMANPTPEIMPEEAAKGGARVIATGRSDYPNQINNVLVFPGIFRGALDAQATDITEEMKLSAARAIASIVSDDELKEDYIIPGATSASPPPSRRRSWTARKHPASANWGNKCFYVAALSAVFKQNTPYILFE